jgi:hypothetical protein
MSIKWNDIQRNHAASGWACSASDAANKCPAGYKADPWQVIGSSKYCGSNCAGLPGGCPTSCSGDQMSRVNWGFGNFTCTPLYDRKQIACFKNNYGTDDATLSKCCSGSTAAKDCDVNYYKGGTVCNDWMQNFCSVGSNMFNNAECATWCNNNQALCDNVKKSACAGDNLRSTPCISWCSRNPDECAANFKAYCTTNAQFSPGSYCETQSLVPGFEIDQTVKNFCADHLNDDYCACYKSIEQSTSASALADPTLAAILSRPECYVTRCSSGAGYQTANMRTNLKGGSCPNVNVCQNTLNALGNTSSGLSNISQSCQQSQQTTTTNSKTDASGKEVVTTPKSTAEVSPLQPLFDKLGYGDVSQQNQFLIIFILIVAIIVGYMSFSSQPKIVYMNTPTNLKS